MSLAVTQLSIYRDYHTEVKCVIRFDYIAQDTRPILQLWCHKTDNESYCEWLPFVKISWRTYCTTSCWQWSKQVIEHAVQMIRRLHRWCLCCIEPVIPPANCSLQAQLKLPSRQFHHVPSWSHCHQPITAHSISYHHYITSYRLNLLWCPMHSSEALYNTYIL